MAEWCMAHPWMTFFLVFFALAVLDNMIGNILRVVAFLLERRKK